MVIRAELELVLSILLLMPACATSMSMLNTGKTLSPGHVQATAAYSVPVHTNLVDAVTDGAKQLDQDLLAVDTISEEQFRDLLDTALNGGLFFTLGAPELMVRTGITDALLEGLDAGLRYNGSQVKLDAKLQVWESASGNSALACSAAYGHQLSGIPGILKNLTLTEFKRHDADFAIPISYEPGNVFRAYLAPRLLLSFVTANPKLSAELTDRLPDSLKDYLPSDYFGDETMLYVGGTGGIMVGYRRLFLNLELTAMKLIFEPTILKQKRDYGGYAIAPSFGATFIW